jgi:hypothetical protein
MPACCSTFERAVDQQFTEKNAIAELKRYRAKGRDQRLACFRMASAAQEC